MQHEKVFHTTINVRNPIGFCADKERHILSELQNTYVGRCFGGVFIVRLVSLLGASACHVVGTNTSGEAYVDVAFLAKVVTFSRWDILVGVRVVDNQQWLRGYYGSPPGDAPVRGDERPGDADARAVVTVTTKDAFAVGQKLAVRVVHAQYSPMHPAASVLGTLLVCDQSAPSYRLRGALDAAARVELAPMLAAVEAELGAREALVARRRADVWFFELLLYAYRDRPGAARKPGADQVVPAWPGGPAWAGPADLVPLPAGAQAQSVLEIVRRVVADGASVPVDGVWSRPLGLYRSSPRAARVPAQDEAAPGAPGDAIDGVPRAVFALYLNNILSFLVAIRELTSTYDSHELVAQHLNLWTAMRAAQKVAP